MILLAKLIFLDAISVECGVTIIFTLFFLASSICFFFNSWFPVNPVVGIKLGKELTPVFGLEVEGTAVFGDNIYRRGFNASIPAVGSFNMHKNGSTNTFFKATTVGLNGVINLSNLVLGYAGSPRAFEIKTNVSVYYITKR